MGAAQAQGVPARVLRELTEKEMAWMHDGTRAYQDLTHRCRESFKEVMPLAAPEPNRKRLDVSAVIPLYKAKGG